jgi:2-oxoglutarate dehydrogenase E2 component (dihydrolipoamide succinyltransferase)
MADEAQVFAMPKLGETVTEGTIGHWLKAVGDTVAFDDALVEVSTDKVDTEIPSPFDGTVLEILVSEGETVPVGTPLARIGAPGAAPAAATAPAPATVPAAVPATTVAPVPTVAPAPAGNGQRALLSPMVRRLAGENGIDLATVPGSGGGGRIMREDIERAIAAQAAAQPATAPPPAAPAVPAMAPPAPAAAPSAPVPQPAPARAAAAAAGAREETVPLSRIRLVTAQRMLASRQTSPHVWTSVEVDLERVEQIRQQRKAQFRKEEGASLTYLPFIARAACDALRAFPAVNSSVDMAGKTMTFHRYVNLAIAVDLDEQGLVAPVIKDADTLNLRGLARAIKAAGDAAKARKLSPDDMSGSTFTITNPGPLASYASAAVINQPNVAIMSTEGVARRPAVVGDAIAIRHMCILGLSYDHRAFDGVTASRFLLFIRDALQDRDWEAELG